MGMSVAMRMRTLNDDLQDELAICRSNNPTATDSKLALNMLQHLSFEDSLWSA